MKERIGAVRVLVAEWRKRYPHTMVLEPLPGYAERMPNRSTRIKAVTRLGPEGAPRRRMTTPAP